MKIADKVMKMRALSNEILLETYVKALDLELESDFIRMLYAEINRRKLAVRHSLPLPI